ncbi:MAG: urease accessory protein [Saprospiraceae bacterium]|nr:urease accessory protein [Saprospiraceae bacterium]
MESTFPLLFAAIVGFSHAFEADHLVAVGSLVTKRDKLIPAIKDGIYWGLGHSSMVLIIGMIMIVAKATFLNDYFQHFEAAVGLMLVLLGLARFTQYYRHRNQAEQLVSTTGGHHLAYGVGLVHGLAGSGMMILLVMTEIGDSVRSITYLIIFGIGSIVGMLAAAGIFSLPFLKRFIDNQALRAGLIVISSLLCIGYGAYVMIVNLT